MSKLLSRLIYHILSAVRRQFSWTQLKSVMYLSDPLARQFYMQMCYYEHWDTRTLDEKVVVRKIRITTPHGAMILMVFCLGIGKIWGL